MIRECVAGLFGADCEDDCLENLDPCAIACLNPLNWIKPNPLLRMAQNKKQLKKRIDALQKQVAEHEQKVQNNPQSRGVEHWKAEIRNWASIIERLMKRL
jgi:hypothetical protein